MLEMLDAKVLLDAEKIGLKMLMKTTTEGSGWIEMGRDAMQLIRYDYSLIYLFLHNRKSLFYIYTFLLFM